MPHGAQKSGSREFSEGSGCGCCVLGRLTFGEVPVGEVLIRGLKRANLGDQVARQAAWALGRVARRVGKPDAARELGQGRRVGGTLDVRNSRRASNEVLGIIGEQRQLPAALARAHDGQLGAAATCGRPAQQPCDLPTRVACQRNQLYITRGRSTLSEKTAVIN